MVMNCVVPVPTWLNVPVASLLNAVAPLLLPNAVSVELLLAVQDPLLFTVPLLK
jgi:hypothetical protein